MKKSNRLELYYTLFSLMVENPWITPHMMADRFKYMGRGRSAVTFLRHTQNMYRKEISREPRLTLKPFEDCQTTVYFCRKVDNKGLATTLSALSEDSRITYTILLSGTDLFLTSRDEDLSLGIYGLDILEKSKLYTPIYTIPKGWDTPVNEALEGLAEIDLRKGLIPREVYSGFSWSEIDWKIFDIMSESVRTKISLVAKKTSVDYKTAKSHFFNMVLPSCVIAHYFFPKGYSSYLQSFIRIHSQYEVEIVKALEKLPCTTYVYPLEGEVVVNIFHENQREILTLLEKMEEKTILEGFLLYAPLYHVYPEVSASDE